MASTSIVTPGTSAIAYPAFLDGQTKRMLIGNQWVSSASGKTFDSINPATGEVLATVSEGDAEDINRAVAAARRAFEGPWSKFKPYERQMLLLKLADLVEQHFDELRIDTLDMGAPISRTRVRAVNELWGCYATMPAWQRPSMVRPSKTPCRARCFHIPSRNRFVGWGNLPWKGPFFATHWKDRTFLATGRTGGVKAGGGRAATPLRVRKACSGGGVPEGGQKSRGGR